MLPPIIGFDPGIRTSAMVIITSSQVHRQLDISYAAVNGPRLDDLIAAGQDFYGSHACTTIEGYKPRSNFIQDARLTEAVAYLKQHVPHSKLLDNMGVKKIITPQLMELLEVWTFPRKTHHQDLRAAARIGLFGAIKEPKLNPHVAMLVHDLLLHKDQYTITKEELPT